MVSGIEAHCAFDKEVDVEDEQLYAGVNGGRQVKAGEVLAVPPKCAVKRQRMVANTLGFDKGTLEVTQGSRRQTLGASRFPLSKPHIFYVLQWKPTLHKPSS